MTNHKGVVSGRPRRLALAIGASISVLALVTACSGSSGSSSANPAAKAASGTPKMGGTLTIPGLNGVPSPDLSWLQAGYNVGNNGLSAMIQGTLFDSPTKVGGPVVPDLATGYSYKNDNKTVTINLRKGVTFTDGTPLNAAAIVWLWGPTFDRNPSSKAATYLTGVTSVKAVNNLTVEVDFSTPNTTFVPALGSEPVGFVASPTAFAKEGANNFDVNPVGAGSYTLSSHVPNQSIVIKKNPSYWNAKHVYLSSIKEILTGTDATANYQALETGQVDLLTSLNVFFSDPEVIQQAVNNPKFANAPQAGAAFAFVDFTNSAPFNNKLAREALAYCTNREPIAKNTLEGYAEPTYIWGGPATGMNFYPKDAKTGKPTVAAAQKLNPYSYDPAKGKALVKRLGGLSFTLTSDIGTLITTAVQQEWAQCGIKASINLPPAAQYTSILQQGTYQAYIVNTGGVVDPRLFAKYITPQEPLDQQGEVNDPIVTNAFNKSLGESGQALQDDWTTIFKQLNKDAYVLPVIAAPTYVVYDKCINNLAYFGNVLSYQHTWRSCTS